MRLNLSQSSEIMCQIKAQLYDQENETQMVNWLLLFLYHPYGVAVNIAPQVYSLLKRGML